MLTSCLRSEKSKYSHNYKKRDHRYKDGLSNFLEDYIIKHLRSWIDDF